MKRILALLLAALLCLFACAASAETTLTPYAQLENASWISGTDLVCLESRDGCAIATADGAPLTEPVYYRSMEGHYGWIVASKVEGDSLIRGVVSPEGKEITPFQYGDIDILNENWASCVVLKEATADNYDYRAFIGDGYYLIDTVDIYWLPEGRSFTLTRDHFNGAKAYGELINIEDRATGTVTCYDAQFNAVGEVKYTSDDSLARRYTTFSDNGQRGLMDPDGNVVLPASYQYVDTNVKDGYFTVSTGDKYGLADLQGNVVVPAQYDRINTGYYTPGDMGSLYVINGYVCVENDGKLGYVNINGAETCPPRYAKDNLDNNGMSALFTDMSGVMNLLAADGVETPLEGFDSVYPAQYGYGMYYITHDADYDSGLIDWHGVEVLPCDYRTLALSGSGRYLMGQKGYDDPIDVWEIAFDVAEPDAPAEADADVAPAATVIDSALQALTDSPDAAVALLEEAAKLLEGNDAALAILNSALTLLKTDAASNADAVRTLLESVKALL